MKIILPFPNAKLNPNRSKGAHWASTASLRKKARSDANLLTKAAMRGFIVPEGDVEMRVTFVQPDKRHRDRDNLLAAAKPQLDGVADALGINDARFNPVTINKAYGPKPGATIIEILEAA